MKYMNCQKLKAKVTLKQTFRDKQYSNLISEVYNLVVIMLLYVDASFYEFEIH